MSEYHGIMIKEGLRDESVLTGVRILGERKGKRWTLLRVCVDPSEIDEAILSIQKSLVAEPVFYAHFYRDEELVVLFPHRVFYLTPNKETWKPVTDYSKSLGIPEKELDFKPCRFDEETY